MTSNIPTALHLKSLDIPSIHKFGIGFDSIFADLNRLAQAPRGDNYPPYNIVKHDDDNYSIELAIAGFKKEDISIEVDQQQLIIKSKLKDADEDIVELEYLHKGISARHFERSFTLADHVIVKDAKMTDGILKVILERQLPEELKPRTIDISSDK
jgi:molecular chaperone IbpA|tara:strand:+ start:373 stop:837 length:465 start_codon:yes stop_codon:yes gene_type:complete